MYILLTNGRLIETDRIIAVNKALKVTIKTDKISILTETIAFENIQSITIEKPKQ